MLLIVTVYQAYQYLFCEFAKLKNKNKKWVHLILLCSSQCGVQFSQCAGWSGDPSRKVLVSRCFFHQTILCVCRCCPRWYLCSCSAFIHLSLVFSWLSLNLLERPPCVSPSLCFLTHHHSSWCRTFLSPNPPPQQSFGFSFASFPFLASRASLRSLRTPPTMHARSHGNSRTMATRVNFPGRNGRPTGGFPFFYVLMRLKQDERWQSG